jgi:hypothetical protein
MSYPHYLAERMDSGEGWRVITNEGRIVEEGMTERTARFMARDASSSLEQALAVSNIMGKVLGALLK